jgi:hypothetical protein
LDEPPQTVPQGQEVLPSRSPLSLSPCIADFCFLLSALQFVLSGLSFHPSASVLPLSAFSFSAFARLSFSFSVCQLFSMSAFQLFSFSAFARLSFSLSAFN